jgi:hypothetical protein
MKKIAVFLVVLIAAVGGFLAYIKVSPNRIVLPSVEPAVDPNAKLNQVFPRRSSQVTVTARLPFTKIRSLAEKAVPQSYDREYGVPDNSGFSGIRVNPNLARDPLSLSPDVNSSPPKVQLASRLHGTVGVKAFKWIIAKVTPLGPTLKTKSPDVGATLNVDANIHGWISPGIDPHWTLTHQEQFSVDVNQAQTKIFGIIQVSLKNEVQKLVNGAAPGLIAKALDSVRDSMPIRSKVEEAWKGMFKPVPIGSGPEAYALLTPEKVRLQRVVFDDPQFLTIRAAIEGKLQTAVTSQTPKDPTPTPLPDLVLESAISPKFHVLLPLGVELSSVNPALSSRLSNKRIELDKETIVVIKSISFYSKNGVLYVKMDIEAQNKTLSTQVEGVIFLKCGLAASKESEVLRLKDVDFSLETKNVLAKTASWLLKDTICRRVEDTVKLDISAELKRLQRDVNKRYASLALSPQVMLRPHLDEIRFEGFQLHDNLLIVGFDLSGEMACDIHFPE